MTYSIQLIEMTKKLSFSEFPFNIAAAAAAKSLQSCPTLCDSRDGSPPGSPIPGILQARTLEREGQIESDDTKGRQTISANYLLCDLG